jgi:hypothetical protein
LCITGIALGILLVVAIGAAMGAQEEFSLDPGDAP